MSSSPWIFGSSPRPMAAAGRTIANTLRSAGLEGDPVAGEAHHFNFINSTSSDWISINSSTSGIDQSKAPVGASYSQPDTYITASGLPLDGSTSEAQAHQMPAPRTSTATIEDVQDLLHHSPELQRRTTPDSHSMIDDFDLCASSTLAYEIPHLKTCELDTLDSRQKLEYLTQIKDRALRISELGVPFMVFKDNRSVLVAGKKNSIEYIKDPDTWLKTTLEESNMRSKVSSEVASQSRSSSDHSSMLRNGWDHLKKTLTPHELTELDDLRQRAKFGEMGIVRHPLKPVEKARLKELEEAEAESMMMTETKRLQDHDAKLGISGKAKRVLGVDNDGHYTLKPMPSHESDPIFSRRTGDKRLKRKAAIVGDRRHQRLSKSSTDLRLSTAEGKQKISIGSSEESPTEELSHGQSTETSAEDSSKHIRTRLPRFMAPMRKYRSTETATKTADVNDVFGSQSFPLRKDYIGMPILQSDPVNEPRGDLGSKSLGSVSSSEYSGNERSPIRALGLRIDDLSLHGNASPKSRDMNGANEVHRDGSPSCPPTRIRPAPARVLRRSPNSRLLANMGGLVHQNARSSLAASDTDVAEVSPASSTGNVEVPKSGSSTPTRTSRRPLTAIFSGSEPLAGSNLGSRTPISRSFADRQLEAMSKPADTKRTLRATLPIEGPALPLSLTISAPLGSHPVPEEEKAFARALTKCIESQSSKRQLLTPTKGSPRRPMFSSLPSAVSESDESLYVRRPHTAPEVLAMQPRTYGHAAAPHM